MHRNRLRAVRTQAVRIPTTRSHTSMKRASSALDSSALTLGQHSTVKSHELPTEPDRRRLDADSAAERTATLLSDTTLKREDLARLLDDMHDEEIQKLKICNAKLSSAGYTALVAELSPPFRLGEKIHELDFSNTEFPTIGALLQTIGEKHAGKLRSWNLSKVHFPLSKVTGKPDTSMPLGLQPRHFRLIFDTVQHNKELWYLNLSHHNALGSDVERRHSKTFDREAPIYWLRLLCPKTRIEVLELQHCELTALDFLDIRDMLFDIGCSPQPSLRELHLQGNDPTGQYQSLRILNALNKNRSLEYLALPESTYEQFQKLNDEQKRAFAKRVEECPRLYKLEPEALANTPEMKAVLAPRQADARLTNSVRV